MKLNLYFFIFFSLVSSIVFAEKSPFHFDKISSVEFINLPKTKSDNLVGKSFYRFDTESNDWRPTPMLFPLANFGNNPVFSSIDPVKFTITSNKDTVAVGEEFEITITAEYLPIDPSLMFQFEGSNEFTLKLITPKGFVRTGGDYHDFIDGKVEKNSKVISIKISGFLEFKEDNDCFTLLRSHKGADKNDLFVNSGNFCFSIVDTLIRLKKSSSINSVRNITPLTEIYKPVLSEYDKSLAETADGESFQIQNPKTTFSADCNYVNYSGRLVNLSNTSQQVDKLVYHACGDCRQGYTYSENRQNGNFTTSINKNLAHNESIDFTISNIPIEILNSNFKCVNASFPIVDGGRVNSNFHFDIIISNEDRCNLINNLKIDPLVLKFTKAPSSTACYGSNVVVEVSGCPGDYVWEGFNETSNRLSHTITATTNYTVRCSGASCGGISPITVTTVVKPNPNSPVLNYTSANEPASVTAVCQAGNFVFWDGNPLLTSTTRTNLCENTYNAYCVKDGCISQPSSFVVNNFTPPQPIVSFQEKVKPNGQVYIEGSVSNCIYDLKWVSIQGGINGFSGTPIEAQPNKTYYVVCKNSCESSPITTAKYTPVQAISLSSAASVLCSGSTTTLTASGCYDNQTATFYKLTSGWTSFGTSDKAHSFSVSGAGQGTYKVTCGDVTSNTIAISGISNIFAPIISFKGANTACGENSVIIEAEGCSGGQIVWSNGKTGNEIEVKTSGIAYTAKCRFECDNQNNDGPNSSPLTPTYNAECDCNTVAISSNGENNYFDWGSKAELKINKLTGATYSWTVPESSRTFSNLNSNTLDIPDITTSDAGTYTVTVSGYSNNLCNTTYTIAITVGTQPQTSCDFSPEAFSTSPDFQRAVDEEVILVGNGGDEYYWTGPNGFVSTERWVVFKEIKKWQAGSYNVTITKKTDGVVCATETLPVEVKIRDCNLVAEPLFYENNNYFSFDINSNIGLSQADIGWYKGGFKLSSSKSPFFLKTDINNRGTWTLKVVYKSCTVEKSFEVDYIAPPSYQGNLAEVSCKRIWGWVKDVNNAYKRNQYKAYLKIDNTFFDIYINPLGNGEVSYFSFENEQLAGFDDGLEHSVELYNQNYQRIGYETYRSFRCCNIALASSPEINCQTNQIQVSATNVSNSSVPLYFNIVKQLRDEDGNEVFDLTQGNNWVGPITGTTSHTFNFEGNANYRVSIREYENGCKVSTMIPVLCSNIENDQCNPPVITVFPSNTFREGEGIVPKLYATTYPFVMNEEKSGLILDGSSSVNTSDYSFLTSNFSIETTVMPDENSIISVGDINDNSRQRFVYYGWHNGDPNKAGVSLSVGSNGINLIEYGYSYKRVVLSYEGPVKGWTHIGVVYQNNKAKLFVNGKLVKASTQLPPVGINIVGPSNIGRGNNSGFKGAIFAYRLWATTLLDPVVSQLKNNFNPETSASPNVGFWMFNKAPNGTKIEDLSPNKRPLLLEGGSFILLPSNKVENPISPEIKWYLNGVQVGAGDVYTIPRDKVKSGNYVYTAKFQKPDGSYCESNTTVNIEPIIFGSLSGCYLVKSEVDSYPIQPVFDAPNGKYVLRNAYNSQSSERQIWRFEHLGNEVYRINSAFYTDMAMEHTGGYYLELKDKRTSSEGQKFKAEVQNAGSLIFSFLPQNDQSKTISTDFFSAYEYNVSVVPKSSAYNQYQNFKLIPTACPVPPSDCDNNNKLVFERWLEPSVINSDYTWFDALNVKQHIAQNPNHYTTTINSNSFQVDNNTLSGPLSTPKPANWTDDSRVVGKLSGYLCAPKNGDYTFFLKSYEWAELYLSTDEDPLNKQKIATNYQQAFNYTTSWDQRSLPVTLSKGRSYYIEMVFKDYAGGVNAEVAWFQPGQWCCENELQPIPLTHFSSVPRDVEQGFLTVSTNKTKVALNESVTLTANGCYLGKVSWKAGIEVLNGANGSSLPAITRVGPGIYQAICVGDPTVTQDWVTVTIDPIVDVVPIPSGQSYACINQTFPLTASVPNFWSYKWYVLKDEASKVFFAQNSAASNLFETAQYLFNIYTTQQINVTGPGSYFLQTISPGGWPSQIREFVVQNAIPENLSATNTSPVPLGNAVMLSVGQVVSATGYSWTGPNAFTSTSRTPSIAALTDQNLGTYTVSIAISGGCTFTATTAVTVSNCDIYLQGFDANGAETTELQRVSGQTSVFQPLKLQIKPFEGTSTFTAYNISWLFNGNVIAGAPNKYEYSIDKPGEYKAVLSLKVNPATTCETTININAKPCKTFQDQACGTPVNVTLPDVQAVGVSLATGDKFTAGDYTVVITEITSGSPSGYIGKGYVEMRLVAGILAKKIGVDFTNLVVNECYEMAGGSVITQYDPNWGNIVDVDATFKELKSLIDDLTNKIELFDGSEQSKQDICSGLNEVKGELEKDKELSDEQIQNGLYFLNQSISTFNSSCFSCESNPNSRKAGTTLLGECKLDQFKQEYSNFTSSVQSTKCNCIANKSDLPPISSVKNGTKKVIYCNEYNGTIAQRQCANVYYAYTGLSSSKLNNRNAANHIPSSPIDWLTEQDFIQQYNELFKAVGDITGTFVSPAKRTESYILESAAIVEQFFTQHGDTKFDPEFFKLAGKLKDKYVQSQNFKVSGTVNPIYLEYEILSLGTASLWKNIAIKFPTKAFRLAFEISSAKVIERKVKKEIATIVSGKIITKTPIPTNFNVKTVLKGEIIDGVEHQTALLVEGRAAQLGASTQFTSWSKVLKEAIPDITAVYNRTWSPNSVIRGKVAVSNEIKNALIEAAEIADNNLYGDRVEAIFTQLLKEKTGLEVVTDGKCGRNCLDLVLTDNIDNIDEATIVIFAEIKGCRANRIEWAFKGARGGYEMQKVWLESVKNQLGTSSKAGKLLERALLENIEVKYVGGFGDKSGNAYIVPLKID
ncbi:MAG: hypothetical protein LCH67_08320 [Bacteroidetes bacterium]|nr:hypothetical protein [Bacteroidota bacterium]